MRLSSLIVTTVIVVAIVTSFDFARKIFQAILSNKDNAATSALPSTLRSELNFVFTIRHIFRQIFWKVEKSCVTWIAPFLQKITIKYIPRDCDSAAWDGCTWIWRWFKDYIKIAGGGRIFAIVNVTRVGGWGESISAIVCFGGLLHVHVNEKSEHLLICLARSLEQGNSTQRMSNDTRT